MSTFGSFILFFKFFKSCPCSVRVASKEAGKELQISAADFYALAGITAIEFSLPKNVPAASRLHVRFLLKCMAG
jgi:hypothetical protein